MEKAYRDLEMSTSYPALAPLPPSVSDVNTKKKAKAYGNSLKHRVIEIWRREVLQVSPILPTGIQQACGEDVGVCQSFVCRSLQELVHPSTLSAQFLGGFGILFASDQNPRPEHHPYTRTPTQWNATSAIPGTTVPSLSRKEPG